MTPVKLHTKSFLLSLWAFGCSLKLAITLATVATVLIMGGSLVMHFNPAIFGGMEEEILSIWLPQAWQRAPLLVFWVPASGICVILFGINTICCLIDWLSKFKTRWRKTGEYLIHAGFILLVIAYLWGSIAGFRSGPHQLFPGESLVIPDMPEYTLRLEEFNSQLEPSGRPLDMVNRVSLWKDEQRLLEAQVRINHPLIYDGLIVLPTSFGQALQGFRFQLQGGGAVDLAAGSQLPISAEQTLFVHELLPDARRNSRGNVTQTGSRLNNPAMLLSLRDLSGEIWSGWYFLREPVPQALRNAGVYLNPVQPLHKTFSLLTINRDPGDKLALVGSILISIGVIFAFFSFYRKRAQGDRPEV